MSCYIVPYNNTNNSSTSTVSGVSTTTLVFNELVEFIHKICCPVNTGSAPQVKRVRGADIDIISEPSTHETLT